MMVMKTATGVVSPVCATETGPAEDAKREKKKRRQLPAELPRRDVVIHSPAGE